MRLAAMLITVAAHGVAAAQSTSEQGATTGVTDSIADDRTWYSLSEALARASASQRPIAVFVSAAWCGPCHQMEKEVFPNDAIAPLLSRFERARLTFDAFDRMVDIGPYSLSEAKWAERLGASNTPTLVFMSSDGAIIGSYTGFAPVEALVEILESVVGTDTLGPSTNTHDDL